MSTRFLQRSLLAALLGAPLFLLAACGGGYGSGYGGGYGPPPGIPLGSAEVDNLSGEFVEGFYLAPSGTGAFTGELLGTPLPPGYVQYVGDFEEDTYDAEADLEFGDLVQWFDVPVPASDTTTFEVY
jgi:hypothetical protein